jgi:hypothetical protein
VEERGVDRRAVSGEAGAVGVWRLAGVEGLGREFGVEGRRRDVFCLFFALCFFPFLMT